MDNKKPVLIIGAGTIGKIAYDIFTTNKVVVYGFLDDKLEEGTSIDEVSVLGKIDDETYFNIIGKDCEVFVASDENDFKTKLVDDITDKRKTMPSNAVHLDANVSETSFLGYGNLVAKGASIGAFATVENHCVVLSNALVDTDAVCKDYVQIGAGAIVNSGVEIEEGAYIGSGAILVSGVKIGKGAKIGAGSLVITDVPAGKTFFGNPAKEV